MNDLFVSVVIPTYNRREAVCRCLISLKCQRPSFGRFEVVVVDDGSNDGTFEALTSNQYPFELCCVRQENSGATIARNHGAKLSRGEYLVFMDDDIVLAPDTLPTLIHEALAHSRVIVLGSLYLPADITDHSLFARSDPHNLFRPTNSGWVPFQECMTGLLAVERDLFFELGMFMDPTGGWPNWDDVDFGYRAAQAGVPLWRSGAAIAAHWDQSAGSLAAASRRAYAAAKSAPKLFAVHPGVEVHLQMFTDKHPISWGKDSWKLVARKLARSVTASHHTIAFMERVTTLLERGIGSAAILTPIYSCILSGYIHRGYRAGLLQTRTLDDAV